MPSVGSDSPRHRFSRIDRSDLALVVDQMVAKQELLTLNVNHPVCWRTAHRFRMLDHIPVAVDSPQLVRRTVGQVGTIGIGPKRICPRNDGANANFAFLIRVGEVRINPRDLRRRLLSSARVWQAQNEECGENKTNVLPKTHMLQWKISHLHWSGY